MVGALERGHVAHPSLADAFEDAKALVAASFLCATHALVHRKVAGKLDTPVAQPLLLELSGAAGREQPEATEEQRTHRRGYARPSAPLHPQNAARAARAALDAFRLRASLEVGTITMTAPATPARKSAMNLERAVG